MDQVITIIRLILDIIIQILTYVRDGLGSFFRFIAQVFESIF
jgi:hypothetical protein